MSAERIDVLAVMDAAGLLVLSQSASDDLGKARAAVAEMIEKGLALLECEGFELEGVPPDSPVGQFAAALARIAPHGKEGV